MAYALGRPRLWYERSGDGEPLLLITGFTISSAVFDPVLELYEPQFDCIRYDNRGSGRSDSPLRPREHACAGGGQNQQRETRCGG